MHFEPRKQELPDSELHSLLDGLFERLFPILRSITGPGVEESMRILGEHMPLTYFGVPSGTQVFDWNTPPEWHCKKAVLTGPDGKVIADKDVFNLHVLNYSDKVDAGLSLDELQPHLYSLPQFPNAVPYVTSYYQRRWGFCISDKLRKSLRPGTYRAKIDSEFVEGQVPLAHSILKGESSQEIMMASYLCHPSMANNELSGPLVLLGLYLRLSKWPVRRHTFRFVLNPETIGALSYLHLHGENLQKNLTAGLVLTCLGGPDASLSYKTSRRGTTRMDRMARRWAKVNPNRMRVREFSPCGGSDERQYCSPGFDLPMGQMARTVYGEYDGYHNSLDSKEFMTIEALVKSIDELEQFLREFDNARRYVNTSPYGEPQLGKRGLYPNLNSAATWKSSNDEVFDERKILERQLMLLNYSDGQHDLDDIADKCGCTPAELQPVAARLEEAGLLKLAGTER